MNKPRFHLAELIDWLALPDGPRDRSLVLRTADWLQEHRLWLDIEATAQLGWEDVVATLQVQDRVSWVVTGRRADLPGEWTCKVAEREFESVWLTRSEAERPELIEFCALDYAVQGRPVMVPTGDRGTAVASALIDRKQEVRVRLISGKLHAWPREDVVFLDEETRT